MMNISMVESEMPPGFRFHPRDEELICDYLMKKVTCCDSTLMIEVDLNKIEPWEIPESACVGGKEWYFYSQRDRKYTIGLRTNRATASGYWKATGKDRHVLLKGTLVGMRKTLVFYTGRAPKGSKTQWVMHEFRLEGLLSPPKEDWVLCRVLHKKREQHIDRDNMGKSYFYDDMSQNHNFKVNQHEQVPCFSNIYPTFTSSNIMEPNNIPIFQQMSSHDFSGIDNDIVLQACLDHFTKLETNSTSVVIPSTRLFGEYKFR